MSATRNAEWRIQPIHGGRAGRYVLGGGTALPLGVPVVVSDNTDDGLGRETVTLTTTAGPPPKPGEGGILWFEEIRYVGVDPFMTTYSDIDTVAPGNAVIVANGREAKIALRNTTQNTFLTRTGYPKVRKMVASAAATPTVRAGDYLTPGDGNDTDGYWESTGTAANAWLVVTHVDTATGLIEARLAF